MNQVQNAISLARVLASSLVRGAQVWNLVKHRKSLIGIAINTLLFMLLAYSSSCYSMDCCEYINVCGLYAELAQVKVSKNTYQGYLAWQYLGIPIDSFKISNQPRLGPDQALVSNFYLINDPKYVNRRFEISCTSDMRIRISYHLDDSIFKGVIYPKNSYVVIKNGIKISKERTKGTVFDKVPNYGIMQRSIMISKHQNVLTCKSSDYSASLLFYAIPWWTSQTRSASYQEVRHNGKH